MKKRVARRFRALQTGLGEEGLELSHQGDWPKTVPCCKCGEPARIAVTLQENGGDGPFITDLHENDPKDGGFWPHDTTAFAIYFCKNIKCATATAHWNQA